MASLPAGPATAAPSNDGFDGAIVIGSIPYRDNQNVGAATRSLGDPQPSCYPLSGVTLWYRFAPSTDMLASVDTLGTRGHLAVAAVYTGSSVATLREEACTTTRSGSDGGQTLFTFRAGVTYTIMSNIVRGSGIVGYDLRLVSPPDANDGFAGAAPIALGGQVSVDLSAATAESGEQLNRCLADERSFDRDRSAWFAIRPSSNTGVVIAATGTGFYGLAVWSGKSLGSLAEIRCDDSTDAPERTGFRARAGETYWLQVSAFERDVVQVNIAVSTAALVAHDDFDQPTPVGTDGIAETVGLTVASPEYGEPRHDCRYMFSDDPGLKSVWYQLTLPDKRGVKLAVTPVGGNASIVAYRGTSLSSLQPLGCQGVTSFSHRSWSGVLEPGTYYVRVESVDGSVTAAVAITTHARPVNDDLSAAADIAALPATVTGNLQWATNEAGEPNDWRCLASSGSIWYRHTVTEESGLELSVGQGASVAIFEGSEYGSLRSIGCSHDAIRWRGAPGRTYVFQVRSYASNATETPTITLARSATWPNRSFEDARPVASVPFADEIGAGHELAAEVAPSCHPKSGGPLWYRYIPERDTKVVVDTAGSTYDTVAVAFRGTERASLQELSCATAGPGGSAQARLGFTARAGETYHLLVTTPVVPDDWYGDPEVRPGTLHLAISESVGPANDEAAHATHVGSLPHSQTTPMADAFTETGEISPSCAGSELGTVWYRVELPSTTGVLVEASSTAGPASIAVRADSPAGAEVVCQRGRAAFRSDPGRVHYVQVAAGGTLQVAFGATAVPASDRLADAIVADRPRVEAAAIGAFTDQRTTDGAGTDATEPVLAGVGATVWYQYHATAPLALTASTHGTPFDTVLAVYEITPQGLALVTTNDNWFGAPQSQATFTAVTGRSYLMAVGGKSGASGPLSFRLSATA